MKNKTIGHSISIGSWLLEKAKGQQNIKKYQQEERGPFWLSGWASQLEVLQAPWPNSSLTWFVCVPCGTSPTPRAPDLCAGDHPVLVDVVQAEGPPQLLLKAGGGLAKSFVRDE